MPGIMKFGINVGMKATQRAGGPRLQGRRLLTSKLFIFAVKPRIRAAHHMARSRSLSFWELSHVSRNWREMRMKEEACLIAFQRTER